MSKWVIAPRAPEEFIEALKAAGIDPLAAQMLHARGVRSLEEAQGFLEPTRRARPVDNFGLVDLRMAVDRILAAIDGSEPIVVYGDYDCDGVTACALMHHTLAALGASFRIYIPNRFEEGYGLNAKALETLQAEGARLVITVDCGIRAMREADRARALGLDLIITDHHELADETIPDALAVVNPKRAGSYAFDKLAGVGVAFRLAQALLRETRARGKAPALAESALLDLVAIGTVADVVPLEGENRALVRAGLDLINKGARLGVAALMRAARVTPGKVDAQTIGFTLGPRLNAAGRLDTAQAAYELLTTDNPVWAEELAAALNHKNEQRQHVTAETARSAAEVAKDAPLMFAAGADYNAGVIGLAAARLVEKFYRPSVVVTLSEGEARGSCRSVPGFDITAALDQCRDLLSRHGGHAAAAGFTTTPDKLDALRERLQAIAGAQQPEGGWQRLIRADAELELSGLSWKTLEQLRQLEPHGAGNPRPVMVARAAKVFGVGRMGRGAEGEAPPHLKLRLHDKREAAWEAVGWRMGDRAGEAPAGTAIDLAFQLEVNEWNGEKRMQLVLQDFRAAEA